MDRFGDSKMSAREATQIVTSAFPAAYEWLLKPLGRTVCALGPCARRWFGADAVTEGAVLRRRLAHDLRRPELEEEARRLRGEDP